jgi:hypothetical protein
MGVHAEHWRLVKVLTIMPVLMPSGDLAKRAPGAVGAFFLDVDGTLLDILPRSEDVVADGKVRRLLAELPKRRMARLPLSADGRSQTLTVFSHLWFSPQPDCTARKSGFLTAHEDAVIVG